MQGTGEAADLAIQERDGFIVTSYKEGRMDGLSFEDMFTEGTHSTQQVGSVEYQEKDKFLANWLEKFKTVMEGK